MEVPSIFSPSAVKRSTFANGSNSLNSPSITFPVITDCEKINGFNNDFEGWGREDSEFILRLINSGIQRS